MTTHTCVPESTTATISAAMLSTIAGVDADLAAAEDLAGQLEHHPSVLARTGRIGLAHNRLTSRVRAGADPAVSALIGAPSTDHTDRGPRESAERSVRSGFVGDLRRLLRSARSR
jgi:hypothetical protein